MASSRKKVVVRQFDGSITWGYASPGGFLHAGKVEILDPAARIQTLDLKSIKTIAYVKDFNMDDSQDPERIGRRTFPGRPRAEGLWLKLEFQDRDTLEGLVQLDLGFLESIAEDQGLFLAPPDPKANTHRLFVPRSALSGVQVLGWITAPSRHRLSKASVKANDQADLFPL